MSMIASKATTSAKSMTTEADARRMYCSQPVNASQVLHNKRIRASRTGLVCNHYFFMGQTHAQGYRCSMAYCCSLLQDGSSVQN